MKIQHYTGKKVLTAKLAFNDGFAERPIYSIRAKTTEKLKGIYMVELIMNNFGLSRQDLEEKQQEDIKSMTKDFNKQKVKWTRNDEGNIISPFDKQIKR